MCNEVMWPYIWFFWIYDTCIKHMNLRFFKLSFTMACIDIQHSFNNNWFIIYTHSVANKIIQIQFKKNVNLIIPLIRKPKWKTGFDKNWSLNTLCWFCKRSYLTTVEYYGLKICTLLPLCSYFTVYLTLSGNVTFQLEQYENCTKGC